MKQKCSVKTGFLRLLLLPTIAAGSLRAANYHPVAAVKAPSGSLFVLTAEDTVFAVNMNLTSGSVVGRFTFKTAGIVTDMAYGEVGGQPMLFIGDSHSTGQLIQGGVYQFTTDGRLVQSWTIQHVVAGLTFNPANQTVYLTSGDSPEIYAISLGPKSSPRYVAEVTGGSRLGAIAIDPAGQHFYLADVRQGIVFSMSASNHKVAQIGQVETAQALLVDTIGQHLIVADTNRKRVESISLSPNVGPARVLSPPGSFLVPTGLAWWDDSHLLVVDQEEGTVALVDLGGVRLLYSLTIQ